MGRMIAAGYRPPAVLIVNPYAGRLSDIERQAAIESVVQRFDVELFTTKARDSAISIAAEAAKNGAELVIALGGDGHINEVVNGIAETEAQLGIIPAGTMNVFARALGIPLNPHRGSRASGFEAGATSSNSPVGPDEPALLHVLVRVWFRRGGGGTCGTVSEIQEETR